MVSEYKRAIAETERVEVMKKKTIWKKLLAPVMALLCVQALLYSLLIFKGGILDKVDENACRVLDKQVESRGNYLVDEMHKHWLNLSESRSEITASIETALVENHATIADIKTDAQLNRTITENLADKILFLLRKNSVTGAFLVLDGPIVEKAGYEDFRAGLYFRDTDPSSYSRENEDILMVRGAASISKEEEIPLDSYWDTGFDFSADTMISDTSFFTKPMSAVLKTDPKKRDLFDYGYLSSAFSFDPSDIQVVTYTIPLMNQQGQVYGVLGVDLSVNYLKSRLKADELEEDGTGIYLLGLRDKKEQTIKKVVESGSGYLEDYGDSDVLTLKEAVKKRAFLLENKEQDIPDIYAEIQSLDVYEKNSVFQNDNWVLVGLVDENHLFSFSSQVKRLVILSLFFTLILGVVCAYIISRILTRPIERLVAESKRQRIEKAGFSYEIQPIGIYEIDELTSAIEELNQDVNKTTEKISTILMAANIKSGIFEYQKNSDSVFCSTTLFKMMGWDFGQEDFQYMNRQDFEEKMQVLKNNVSDEGDYIFYLEELGKKWYHLTLIDKDEESLIGVLEDITQEREEKQKLEYERDYDVLTELLNRRGLNKRIRKLLHQSDKMMVGAMIMCDLDNLKYVNDTYGHEWGDAYIRSFADILRSLDQNHAIVGRRSGDEFLAFIFGYESKEEARVMIQELEEKRDEAYLTIHGEQQIRIKASIGISWYPYDSVEFDELVRYADFMMYIVKHNEKGHVMEFNRTIYQDNAFLLDGAEELNHLFDSRMMQFAMQPIVNTKDGSIYGYEMLMRPDLEYLHSSLDVLQLAKLQSKLYQVEILSWFTGMKTFVEQIKKGAIRGNERVFLNSIANQILNEEDMYCFETMFKNYLDRIVLEFTEGEPQEKEYTKRKVAYIEKWGGKIAIDDYGAGHNSEAILLQFLPDFVKVDIEIIRGIDQDKDRQDIFYSLLIYARERQIKVIAEGIENEKEMRRLLAYGVDYMQGFFLAKPDFEIAHLNEEALKLIEGNNLQ